MKNILNEKKNIKNNSMKNIAANSIQTHTHTHTYINQAKANCLSQNVYQ